MDRKNFLKCTCNIGVGSCIGLSLLANENLFAGTSQDDKTDKKTPVVPVDTRQVQNVLCFVDATMDESIKKNIFEKLGYEHTTDPGFVNWINGYKKNLKSFFDHVNSNKDTYWEKMEYDPETSAIKITGKVVDRCACPYAQSDNPPKSLCNYCCIGFQKAMFEMMLDKKVTVKVDDAYLLGGNRCSSMVYVDGKLDLEKI